MNRVGWYSSHQTRGEISHIYKSTPPSPGAANGLPAHKICDLCAMPRYWFLVPKRTVPFLPYHTARNLSVGCWQALATVGDRRAIGNGEHGEGISQPQPYNKWLSVYKSWAHLAWADDQINHIPTTPSRPGITVAARTWLVRNQDVRPLSVPLSVLG